MKPIVEYEGKKLYLQKGSYPNNRVAFLLVDEDDELWDDLSINLPDKFVMENEFFINPRIPNDLREKLFETDVFMNLFRTEDNYYNSAYVNKNLLKDYIDDKYYIEIWETEWHRDAGDGFMYVYSYEDFDTALKHVRKLKDDYNYAAIEIINNNNTLYCFADDEETFYFDSDKIVCVDDKLSNDYVEKWTEHKELPIKEEKIYCKRNEIFIGIDNSTGDCWVEEFKTEKEVQEWLLGKEKEYEI